MNNNIRLKNKITRRDFLKKSSQITSGTIGLLYGLKKNTLASNSSKLGSNRVIWLHDSNATFWDGNGYYGDYIIQSRVNAMLEAGIKSLTGESNIVNAWNQILPNYTNGEKIVIKINMNNTGNGTAIDATPAPVISLISGLKAIGVLETDIYIMDPSNFISSLFANPILSLYPEVSIWDANGSQGYQVTYNYDPGTSTTIQHSNPGLTGSNQYSYMPEQLGTATYLINIPIMKGHGAGVISLVFKNCFGLLKAYTIAKLHDYSLPYRSNYSYDMNPLHDIYLNANIRDKTVLIVGDGLFCSRKETAAVPEVWNTFNGEFPNSIFLSTDPVAIDSVMFDFLNAESPRFAGSQLYLHRAEELFLGTHEHWSDPINRQYTNIDFRQIEMSNINRFNIDQKIKEFKEGNATLPEVRELINLYLKGN